VIELRSRPLDSRVAALASRRKSGGCVIRVLRITEIGQVTRGTICRSTLELAIHMALRAGDGDMCAGERELRERIVIELSTCPACSRVTRSALTRQSGGNVIRIGRRVVILGVTRVTDCASALKLAANVTTLAGQAGMGSRQGKPCNLCVIEFRAAPSIERVTRRTSGAESRRDVVWTLGGAELLHVARRAICRKPLELSGGCGLVARGAVGGRMRSKQWEAILVLVDHRNGDLPALDGVATVALRAELPFVNVSVAIGAFLTNVGENKFRMTLRTRNTGVHSPQRILCLIVIEFRDLPNGCPRSECVAILTSHRQGRAVRAARGLTRRRLRLSVCRGRRQQQEEHHDLCK
jgi:hypothetical protein